MALNVDTSKPIRLASDLRDLAAAVRAAAPADESHWIEWKGPLDLTRAAGRFAVARAILGFGNRRHDRAATITGGYAYLLVGVEPGSVAGVVQVDPADLDQGLRPYIGDNPPGWTATYVTVDGESVLVVVVDPPKWGDPIHLLRKTYENTEAGTIFVRGIGKTERATPSDIEYLVGRANGGRTGLSLTVATRPTPLTVPALLDVTPVVDAWIDAERVALLQPLEQKPVEPPSVISLGDLTPRVKAADAAGKGMSLRQAQDIERRLAAGEEVSAEEKSRYEEETRKLSAAMNPIAERLASSAMGLYRKEDRSPDKYREEVDKYLQRARKALLEQMQAAYIDMDHGRFEVELTNQTDRNFSGVQLVLRIPGVVQAIDPDEKPDPAKMPARPRIFGTPRPFVDPTERLALAYRPTLKVPTPKSLPRVVIDNEGTVSLTYRAIDLRPHETRSMPLTYLFVGEAAGTDLTVSWRATATNSDGVVSGEFPVNVPAPVDLKVFLPPHET